MKTACSEALCCILLFQLLPQSAWSWPLFHLGKMTLKQGRFPQAFPECGPRTRKQTLVKALEQLGCFHSPYLALLESVPREKLAESVQGNEEFFKEVLPLASGLESCWWGIRWQYHRVSFLCNFLHVFFKNASIFNFCLAVGLSGLILFGTMLPGPGCLFPSPG